MLNEKIMRVSDDRAEKLNGEGWKYVPKSMWKEKVKKENTNRNKTVKKGKKK